MKFTVDSELAGAFTSGDHIMTASEAMRIEHWRKSFEEWVGIDNYEIDWDGPKTKDAFITFYNRFGDDILAKQRCFFYLPDEETPLETLFEYTIHLLCYTVMGNHSSFAALYFGNFSYLLPPCDFG